MKINHFLLLSALLMPVICHGADNEESTKPKKYQSYKVISEKNTDWKGKRGKWLFGGKIGGAVPNIKSSGLISRGCCNEYYDDIDEKGAFLFGLFGGYCWALGGVWLPFITVQGEYVHAAKAEIDGDIGLLGMSSLNSHRASYKVSRNTFMARGKIHLFSWDSIMPYLTAALGVSLNRFSNYQESLNPGCLMRRISLGYGDSTYTDFCYNIGGGVDIALTKNTWLGVECNYGDYGTIRSGVSAQGCGSFGGVRLRNDFRSVDIFLTITRFFN